MFEHEVEANITTRRSSATKKYKMASSSKDMGDLGINEMDGSLFIDNILSQDETCDVLSMFDMADELQGGTGLLSFCTSTQMGRVASVSVQCPPALSPIRHEGGRGGQSNSTGKKTVTDPVESKNKFNSLPGEIFIENSEKIEENAAPGRAGIRDGESVTKGRKTREDETAVVEGNRGDVAEEDSGGVNDLGEVCKHDLERDGERGDESVQDAMVQVEEQEENESDASQEEGEGGDSGDECGDDEDDQKGMIGDGGENKEGTPIVQTQMEKVIDLLTKLDSRSTNLDTHVKSLETSLEFSQQEIDTLKKENAELKGKLDALSTEDKRTQFQLKAVDDRMERLETVAKKKNLVLEGVPETDGKREEVEKTVCNVLDKLSINKPINLDACYRVGPYSRTRPRSIIVNFEKQADRDAVYARRTELKNTRDLHQVWINEDVGPASKRKQGILRLISREAQNQGIDCRTGKYTIHIDKVKYDDNNWDDLPPQLQPASLKQVRIDKDTLAYQSEFAPFSNFFACDTKFGQHTFFCLEQAYQFVRAKTLNKPLAATRIFLSRDVHYIKQVGNELGTSELWEKRKFDVMYVCLMSKFEQNQNLKDLLLNTGKLQLVEATPDRLWGCGATLSSNALRRHDWPGQNKHGETLMTVREELKRREEKRERSN